MKYLKVAAVLCLALLFCGCSLFRKKAEIYPVGPLFPVTVAASIPYKGEIVPPMSVSGDMIYFATDEGYLYKIYVYGQRTYFEKALGQKPLDAPVIHDSGIYILCQEGKIVALDKDGSTRWETTLPELPSTQLAFVQDRMFTGTDKGNIFSIELGDGEIQEICHLLAPVSSLQSDKKDLLFAGCSNGTVHLVGKDGQARQIVQIQGKIMDHMMLNGRRLFFSSDLGILYHLNLVHMKIKWKIDVGSRIEAPMHSNGKYLFVLSWNGILYRINQKSGSIGWWRAIPSRSLSGMSFSNDRVIVSSMSPAILCFDIPTGRQVGYFYAESEMRSHPAWVEPFLLCHIYDRKNGQGKILYLKKYIEIGLDASKRSPQMLNEEIVFTATAYGFHNPEYAFFFLYDDKEKSVLNPSDENTWTWYPDKAGNYTIKVRITDEKIKLERELKFIIKEKLMNEKEYAIYMKILKLLLKMKWSIR